jgi:small subunit ribosomal protein S1
VVAAEYQEHFGEHQYDAEGNYIGPAIEHSEEAEAAWAEYFEAPDEGEKPAESAAPAAAEADDQAAAADPEGVDDA